MIRATTLEMFRGDSASWRFTVTDADGAAVNLTNADLRFTAKSSASDADVDAIIAKTDGAGITVTDAAGGVLAVTLSPGDTSALTVPQTLVWDLQVTDALGAVQTLAYGALRIIADIEDRTVTRSGGQAHPHARRPGPVPGDDQQHGQPVHGRRAS